MGDFRPVEVRMMEAAQAIAHQLEEDAAQMRSEIEDSYRNACRELSQAKDSTEVLIAFGRKQALGELMNIYGMGV